MALDNLLWLENAGAVYNAIEYRHLMQALLGIAGTGVFSPLDLKVTQRGAGANMSVDLAAGNAAVIGTESFPDQGVYVAHSSAVVNLVIGAANSTNPRYDLVVVRVRDTFYSGGTDSVALEIVAGTPAGSPTEPATPANSFVLARVLVPASSSSVVNANITDRRTLVGPEKFPAGRLQTKTLGSTTSGIVTTTTVAGSTITQTVNAGRQVRYACAIRLTGTVLNDVMSWQIQRDGVGIGPQYDVPIIRTDSAFTIILEADDDPSAGSHVYRVAGLRSIGTGSAAVDASGWARLDDTGAHVA